MPIAYVHMVVIMMRYLISQVWGEQTINAHLFDNANYYWIKKTSWKNIKLQTDEED